MQEKITRLWEEKRQIEENPELPISKKTRCLRQRLFKANHIKKKNINLELSLATSIAANVEPLQIIYPNNYSRNEEMEFGNGDNY